MGVNMSQGAFARLDIGGTEVCFTRIENKTVYSLVDRSDESICGSPLHDKASVDEGIVVPRLHILMQPSPEELDVLLPWIGFADVSVDTFGYDTDISNWPANVIIDSVAAISDYGNAYVDKAIFRCQKGRHPLTLEVQCVCDQIPDLTGVSWTGSAPTNTGPLPFHRAVLTAESATREFSSFVFIVDNHLAVQHNNSRFPTGFEIGGPGATFHLGIDTPWVSGTTALLTNPAASVAGAGGSIVFTRGGQSTTFTFTNLKSEINPPSIMKEEIRLKTFYKAYANGATKPVIITHDATA